MLDGTESAIPTVYWTILIVFFVLAILSWLVASRDWFKEESAGTESRKEQTEEAPNNPA